MVSRLVEAAGMRAFDHPPRAGRRNALFLFSEHNIINILFGPLGASKIIKWVCLCKEKGPPQAGNVPRIAASPGRKSMDRRQGKQPGNASGGNGKDRAKLEAFVFDFDGTLAELHLDFGEMKRLVGTLAGEYLPEPPVPPAVPALEWLESLAQTIESTNPAAAAEFRARAALLIRELELESARRGRLFPFTRTILEELGRKSVKIAVITRNCEEAVRLVFPDLERFCGALLTRDHVPKVKPDPDHLFRALHKIGSRPETAIMVGDHPLDIRTGRDAGVMTAGVSSGYASRGDLAGSGADWTANNCEELVRTLEREGLL